MQQYNFFVPHMEVDDAGEDGLNAAEGELLEAEREAVRQGLLTQLDCRPDAVKLQELEQAGMTRAAKIKISLLKQNLMDDAICRYTLTDDLDGLTRCVEEEMASRIVQVVRSTLPNMMKTLTDEVSRGYTSLDWTEDTFSGDDDAFAQAFDEYLSTRDQPLPVDLEEDLGNFHINIESIRSQPPPTVETDPPETAQKSPHPPDNTRPETAVLADSLAKQIGKPQRWVREAFSQMKGMPNALMQNMKRFYDAENLRPEFSIGATPARNKPGARAPLPEHMHLEHREALLPYRRQQAEQFGVTTSTKPDRTFTNNSTEVTPPDTAAGAEVAEGEGEVSHIMEGTDTSAQNRMDQGQLRRVVRERLPGNTVSLMAQSRAQQLLLSLMNKRHMATVKLSGDGDSIVLSCGKPAPPADERKQRPDGRIMKPSDVSRMRRNRVREPPPPVTACVIPLKRPVDNDTEQLNHQSPEVKSREAESEAGAPAVLPPINLRSIGEHKSSETPRTVRSTRRSFTSPRNSKLVTPRIPQPSPTPNVVIASESKLASSRQVPTHEKPNPPALKSTQRFEQCQLELVRKKVGRSIFKRKKKLIRELRRSQREEQRLRRESMRVDSIKPVVETRAPLFQTQTAFEQLMSRLRVIEDNSNAADDFEGEHRRAVSIAVSQ